MPLEVRHLKLVAAIAEEGGVTRASHRLHLTQSALSHQLHDAEEQLGTALFQRLSRKMLLTPAGERLLRSARLVIEELRVAEDDVRRRSTGREGVLRIATQCYTNYSWLPERLKQFQRKFPRVDVQVVVEATRRPFEALLEGKLDIAIVSDRLRNRKIGFAPLFSAELVAVMPPDHPLAARSHLEAADFSAEALFVYSSLEETAVFQEVLQPAGVRPACVQHAQLTEAMLEMVKAGLGICVLARWAVAAQVASGDLAAVPVTRKGLFLPWCAATLRGRRAPEYVGEFIDVLARHPLAGEKMKKSRGRTSRSVAAEQRPAPRKGARVSRAS